MPHRGGGYERHHLLRLLSTSPLAFNLLKTEEACYPLEMETSLPAWSVFYRTCPC